LCNINSLNFYECAIIGTPSIFTYQSSKEFNTFSIVEVFLKNKKVKALIIKKTQKPSFKCLDIIKLLYELNEKEQKIVNFISYYYFCSLGEAVSLFTFQKNNPLKKIEIKTDINLTSKQQEAFQFCKNNQVSILFGDTGSGKTEIYIKLIEEVINQNKTAILLLPEIGASLGDRLVAEAREVQEGRPIGLYLMEVTNQKGEKIALAKGVSYHFDRPFPPEGR
jgi:primosomal protein N' (replication factor Y)